MQNRHAHILFCHSRETCPRRLLSGSGNPEAQTYRRVDVRSHDAMQVRQHVRIVPW